MKAICLCVSSCKQNKLEPGGHELHTILHTFGGSQNFSCAAFALRKKTLDQIGFTFSCSTSKSMAVLTSFCPFVVCYFLRNERPAGVGDEKVCSILPARTRPTFAHLSPSKTRTDHQEKCCRCAPYILKPLRLRPLDEVARPSGNG